jgi:PKD repeat protein
MDSLKHVSLVLRNCTGLTLHASFIAVPATGPAPPIVVFTDTSTGQIDNRLWAFGDGETLATALPTVTHTYTITETYTVNLTVSGLYGRDTLTRAGYISVTGSISATHALLSDKHPVMLP